MRAGKLFLPIFIPPHLNMATTEVLSLGDKRYYYLSTQRNDLGVVGAKCAISGVQVGGKRDLSMSQSYFLTSSLDGSCIVGDDAMSKDWCCGAAQSCKNCMIN